VPNSDGTWRSLSVFKSELKAIAFALSLPQGVGASLVLVLVQFLAFRRKNQFLPSAHFSTTCIFRSTMQERLNGF
jgi:hypothetical protein